MKYIDEYRDKKLVQKLADAIRGAAAGRAYTFMEVCGTHTMNIFRFGISELLPGNVRLISGPGCPVCVTPNAYLDRAIALAGLKDVVIATFGDMMRVPGSYSSLEKEKAKGRAIKVVYSSTDALGMAGKLAGKEVVFLGVGFETTAPTVARSIMAAKEGGVSNYSVLCGHKTMPRMMKALLEGGSVSVDGFLLPGHVSAVIGPGPYGFMAKKYGKRCVIAGFEPVDILQAILMLVRQRTPKVEIQYRRIVESSGNRLAEKAIETVFEKAASDWRGIGMVRGSGLRIRKEFAAFDAGRKFRVAVPRARDNKGCACGNVLKGAVKPTDCKLFGRSCAPEHPVGACMVSSEGACAAYYKYG